MQEDLPEGAGGQGVSAGERLEPDSPPLWLCILLPRPRMFKSGELQATVEIFKCTKGCSLPCRPTVLAQSISVWWKTGWPHASCLLEMLPCHLAIGNARGRHKGLGFFLVWVGAGISPIEKQQLRIATLTRSVLSLPPRLHSCERKRTSAL